MLVVNTSNTEQSVLEQVGPNIIHHVSNSSKEHPIIKIPEFFGIFSMPSTSQLNPQVKCNQLSVSLAQFRIIRYLTFLVKGKMITPMIEKATVKRNTPM